MKPKLDKIGYDFVIDELAAGEAPFMIHRELPALGYDVTRYCVYNIARRHQPEIEKRRAELEDKVPIAKRWVRLTQRQRQIDRMKSKIEGHSGAILGYDRIEGLLLKAYREVAEETGDIQSGNRQTNITNVHQGPEESWRTVDKGYRERRLEE